MRIGQLAAAAGVTVQTVRSYERCGLLTPLTRRAFGYRDYPEHAGDEIRAVVGLKARRRACGCGRDVRFQSIKGESA